jgi:exodeoxyribonuclease III
MSIIKLSTWNVNGIRASLDKGLRDYLLGADADIICLQETKAQPEQVDLSWLTGYQAVWNSAVKKGYSGTLVLSRVPVLSHCLGMNIPEHDNEGRMVTVELDSCFVVNVYTPNAQAELARIDYRLTWDRALQNYIRELEQTKPVLLCGDLNCAHKEIDLANPKSNRKNPGFSDGERESFDGYIQQGLLDVLRLFHTGPGCYTWWTQRIATARANNIGWRLDYWLATASLRSRIRGCTIRSDVFGSDHCPVEMTLDTQVATT